MRILILSVLIGCSQISHSDSAISCGLAITQVSLAALDNLQHNSDDYFTSLCHFRQSTPPGKNRWLPAWPTLTWQQGYQTRLSRSELDAKFQHWSLDWPVLRVQQHSLHLLAGGSSLAFSSKFRRNTLLAANAQVISADQPVLIERRSNLYGLSLEIFRPPSILNRLGIQQQTENQALAIQQQLPEKAEVLAPVQLSSYSLHVGLQQIKRGWNFPWQLHLGRGKIRDDQGSFFKNSQINGEFNQLKLQAAVAYRWRWSRTMQLLTSYQLGWQYYDFADQKNGDNYRLSDGYSLSQQLSSRFEWRF